jgi:ribosomal protein S6
MLKEDEIYEISFIFNPNLQEELANQKLEVLKDNIASLKGSFISEETPYLRELSYEMKLPPKVAIDFLISSDLA